MKIDGDYYSWFRHFRSHSNELEQIQKYLLRNAKNFKLDKAKTMVSIGAGCGELDNWLMETCTPQLEHYIGVEPDLKMFESLSSVVKTNGKKITLVNESFPEWMGPSEAVDIVFVCHVLYYILDKMGAIKQFYQWLKPGGSLIVVHSYNDDLFSQIAKENGVFPLNPYTYLELKMEMAKEGFHDYEESQIELYVKNLARDDDTVQTYFETWVGDIPEHQMKGLIKQFREQCEANDNLFTQTQGCMRLEKQAPKGTAVHL